MKKYKKSLDQMINENEISPISAFKYSLQLCRAIKTMHKREDTIIHRDLKPENILYDEEDDKVLICDFGLTHIENGNDSINEGFVGNVDYHAPEQKKRGSKKVGTYTDLYSLGLIINVLFTKEIATGENYKKVWECAPHFQFVDKIVEKMIQHDISKREHDINVVLLEMEEYENKNKKEELFLESQCFNAVVPIEKKQEIINLFSLSNFFLNNDVDWNKINLQYNCDYHFKCSDAMKNSLLLCILHQKLLNVFESESSSFIDLMHSNNSLNIDNSDDKKEFDRLLDNINIEVFDEVSRLPNIIKKYFLSIYDYHAREINSSISRIKDEIDYNCSDASILELIYFVKKNFNHTMHLHSNDFVEFIEYKWNDISSKDILFVDVEKPFEDFVKKIKSVIPSVSYFIRDDKIKIFFEKKEEELQFINIVQRVINNLQNDDVRRKDLNDIIAKPATYSSIKIYIFDFADTKVMNNYFKF